MDSQFPEFELSPGITLPVRFESDGETAAERSEPGSLLFIQVSREMLVVSKNVCIVCSYF